jgi:hypothetical protein
MPAILRTSSAKTRGWVRQIQIEVKTRVPWCDWEEAEYWVTFYSRKTNRVPCQLNPQKNQIRTFLVLPEDFCDELSEAPSTKGWKERYQSLYTITERQMLEEAVELIISAFEYDLHKSH